MAAVVDRSTLNIDEAAQALGVNRLTLYSAIRNGESPVPVIKIGRRLVVPKAALDRLLAGEDVGTGTERVAADREAQGLPPTIDPAVPARVAEILTHQGGDRS